MPRYKIVVQATLGQMKDQGVRVASRCLWDTSVDNYASVTYTNVRAPDAAFSPPCSPSALSLCLPPPGHPRARARERWKEGRPENPLFQPPHASLARWATCCRRRSGAPRWPSASTASEQRSSGKGGKGSSLRVFGSGAVL